MKTGKKKSLVSKIKRIAPSLLFLVPGGAAFGMWYACASQQAALANAMNAAVAEAELGAKKQEFIAMLENLDAQDLELANFDAYEVAEETADEAAMQAALGSDGVDWDKYNEIYGQIFDDIFRTNMSQNLGITKEQYNDMVDLEWAYIESGEDMWSGDFDTEIGDMVAQKWGYADYANFEQAMAPLIEAANNGDEAAAAVLNNMNHMFHYATMDYAYYEPMREYAINAFVDNHFVADVMGEVTALNVMGDNLGMGAVALGLTAVAAGAMYLATRGDKSKDDSAALGK